VSTEQWCGRRVMHQRSTLTTAGVFDPHGYRRRKFHMTTKKPKGSRFTPKVPSFIKNAWHKDCTCRVGHCIYHNYPRPSVKADPT